MKIVLGSDHRGFQLKARLRALLEESGHDVEDVGTNDGHSVDYTDFAAEVAGRVSAQQAERGILVCGSGIGMAITANKFDGVRATTAHDALTAEMCRRHNDVNVLCLSGDILGDRPIDHLVDVWLNTKFDGGRHARRVDKISAIEASRNDC